MPEWGRVRGARSLFVPRRLYRHGLRTGPGRVCNGTARVSQYHVTVHQHAGMVLLQMQVRL